MSDGSPSINRKRRSFLKVTGAAGAIALAGCSGDNGPTPADGSSPTDTEAGGGTAGDPSSSGESLELWVFGGQSASEYDENRQEFISQWEDETGHTVNTTRTPFGQMLDRIQTSMRAGEGPDITQSTVVWTPLLASNDWLAPLTDRINGSDIQQDDFFPQIWRAANLNDEMYGVPINVGSWGLWYYNADMIEEAGYDPMEPEFMRTWDQILDVAPDVKEANEKAPIGIVGADKAGLSVQYTGLFCTSGNNTWLNEEQSSSLLNEDPGLRTAQYYQSLTEEDLLPSGVTNVDQNQMRQLFLNEEIAMYQVGSWERDIIEEQSDIRYGITYLPKMPGGRTSMFGGGFHWVVNQSSDVKDAAWEFITEMTRPEVLLETQSLPPALQEATEQRFDGWTDGLGRDVGHVQLEQMRNAGGFPVHPNTASMNETYRPELQQVLLGNKTAEEAMNDADETITNEYL